MNRARLSRAFGAYQQLRLARSRPASLQGFIAHALRQRALRWIAPPLAALRAGSWRRGALARLLARVWLWCWMAEGLRFERQANDDPFCFWEACAPRDLAMMARCGALLWSDTAPSCRAGGAPGPLLGLCALNCAQAPGIGCDSSDWEDWLSALRALLASALPRERLSLWTGQALSTQGPEEWEPLNLARFFLNALASPPARLLERADIARPALLLNFHAAMELRPAGADFSAHARLALQALGGLDPRGEALWALAAIPEARDALAASEALGAAAERWAPARSFQERLALEALPAASAPQRAARSL